MDLEKQSGRYAWKTAAREFAVKFSFQFFFKKRGHLIHEFSSSQSTFEAEFESFRKSYEALDTEHPSNHLLPESRSLAFKIVQKVVQNFDFLEKSIGPHLRKDWKLSNICKIDHALLLIGVCEILETDTPPPVVISDMVELAKRYGSESSPSFVNGVLDAAVPKK